MLSYQMCPECLAVFFPSEADIKIIIGQHTDKCSKPKIETFNVPLDEAIKQVKERSDWRAKYKNVP